LFIGKAYAQQEPALGDEPKRPQLDEMEGHKNPSPDPTEKTPLEVKTSKGVSQSQEWVVAPIPNYNPSQGWGLALAVQYIFAHESHVKPSIAAGALFGTEKKSYGGMLGYIGRLNEDRQRLNVFGGYAKINSDFYGIGKDQSEKDMSVLLEQDYTFAAIQWLPLIGPFYVGPTLMYNGVKNKFDISGLPPTVDASQKLDSDTVVPGVKAQYDSRDNSFYPTQGSFSNLSAQFFDANWGGDHTFQRYKADYNYYLRVWDDNVLASRAAFQANVGDVPFYDMAVFGQGSDLRGYKAGKYRDKIIWATQAEFRHRWTSHWGAAVFAGVGDVLDSASDLTLTDLLWSGGAGIRYRIGAQNPIDFRVDVAYGDDWAWYFSVNQAF
jgi:hypothetical protein